MKQSKQKEMREELRRLVIEAIHGREYEKAIKKEENDINLLHYHGLEPIAIGRVMQAIKNIGLDASISHTGRMYSYWFIGDGRYADATICQWELTKKNGQERTLEDQADETIASLLNFIKDE